MSGNLLDSIAHPATLPPNLLADAYGAGQRIVSGIWANRQAQAKQAAGQAYLASLNPDGTPNQAKLNQNLVAAGPGVALAAQDASQQGQQIDTATFDTHMKRLTGLNAGAMALTAQYPQGVPQDVVNSELDRLGPAFGLSPTDIAQAKKSFGPDPVANSRTLIRNSVSNLSAQDALHASRRTPITTDDGQVIRGGGAAPLAADQPGVLDVPGATPGPGGQGVQKQTGPDTNAAQNTRYVPDPNHPGQFIAVPVPRSAEPGSSGVAPAPPGSAPAGPIPGNGAYKPRGSVIPQPGGQGGGGPAASGAQPAPPAAAGAHPAPAAGGATQATQPAQPQQTAAAAPPSADPATGLPPGTNLAAPPQGQPDLVAAGNKMYVDAAAAKPDQQKRLIAGETALQALKLASTGPGTGTTAKMYAFLQAQVPGLAPEQGTMSDTAYRQILAKNLLRFAQSSGQSSGTDLGLETKLHENANVDDMLSSANRHVLIQDLGIHRRDMAQTDTMPQGAAAIEHVKKFANTMDPRAFAWDLMEPGERAAIIAQAKAQDLAVDKSGNSHPNLDKLRASLSTALKTGYVKPDPAAPPAPVAPAAPAPAASPNLLASPGGA